MMASRIGRAVGVLFGFGLICSACSGTSTTTTPKKNDPPSGGGGAGDNPTVCSPGTRRCDGHEIKRCADTGKGEIVEQSCSSAQCIDAGDGPVCDLTACAANLGTCDGNTATKCKLDGSGPEPGGVDCTASKQFCRAGECHDTPCAAGTKSCQNGDVYQCSTDGSRLSIWADCADDSEVCEEGSGSCLPRVCVAGKLSCDGTRVLTCNAVGSAFLLATTDCATQGKVCVAGGCKNQACTPSSTFCQGLDLYRCDPTGASSTLSQTCRAGTEHCEVTPAGLYAYCVATACPSGKPVCDGDVVKTCNADGSFPAVGTACGNDQFCEGAVCKPRLCTVGGLFCKDDSVYSCVASGPPVLYRQCDPDQPCLAVLPQVDHITDGTSYANLFYCAPRSCPPDTTGCALNQLGTCGPDGATLSSVTSDCAAQGKVCTADATCAASALDTLGQNKNTEGFAEHSFVGNLVDVRSPRKLTEIELWGLFSSPRDLRWAVYEQVGDDLILRVDKTTTVASSTGFVGSGPLSFSYPLEVGKHYVFGVELSGDGVGRSDSPPLAKDPSFGTLLGGISSFYFDPSDFTVSGHFLSRYPMYMRVTTESP